MPESNQNQGASACPLCERCGGQPLDVTPLCAEHRSFVAPVQCTGLCQPAAWLRATRAKASSVVISGEASPRTLALIAALRSSGQLPPGRG